MIDDGTEPPLADPVAEYVPTGRPGHRAPHLWLGPDESTLDLIGAGVLLFAGPRAKPDLSALSEVPITTRVVEDQEFLDACGIGITGAVLVRPDGHVYWRCRGEDRTVRRRDGLFGRPGSR